MKGIKLAAEVTFTTKTTVKSLGLSIMFSHNNALMYSASLIMISEMWLWSHMIQKKQDTASRDQK